jgi:hypothetical protein
LNIIKEKIADANIGLVFGHLLFEMEEFNKVEIYFNFGRTYRLKGDFNRAIDYYTRAHQLHIKGKPKRFFSAAKTLNMV